MRRDDNLGAAPAEVGSDIIAVKSLVAEQRAELDPLDQWCGANGIEALSR